MSKKKQEDRKQLLIRYRIGDNGSVSFVDPCCDDMPSELFYRIMRALSDIEKKWNKEVDEKSSDTITERI